MTPRSPDDLADVVGHELRSPLTSVLGYAQLLGADTLTEEQRHYVAVIERNGRRLLRLIDEVLVSAQLSAGEFSVARRDVDLAGVVRTCGDELGPAARGAGVSLTVTAPGPAHVSGDRELLAQLVTSLLDGALKRTQRGGAVTVRVTTRAATPETTPEVVIEVADTGAGLGPEELDRLGVRLYRSRGVEGGVEDGTGGALGIGVGLPVARAITDAHGGTLRADSPSGAGTTVTVILAKCSATRDGSTPH
ncbi:sensor histidine kinase [Promicromonospora iranensis]|uniref:histidine kinase n=1 Tax=Promicromonospora iranensis TaxID=1105144 RepID=A0ABU2CH18_9MICO|nr:HAMP domain-containing sensor histidine kinase [Promicromonospora iranensis]MDR7380633.1 signal transduction histidine kinase [Promicromonospora iranensis]